MRFCFCLAAPALCAAQTVPVTSLTPRATAIDGAFTHIGAVRELSGERAVALDNSEHQVWLVDLAHRTRTPVANTGLGALEYETPMALFAAGTGSVLEDFRNGGKIILLDRSGAPTESFPLRSVTGEAAGRSYVELLGADDAGRLYVEVAGIVIDAAGARAVDSAAILRLDRRAARVDTVAFLHLPHGATQASGGRPGEGLSISTGTDNPFAPHDTWVVATNGRVAIVHAQPYRIEWIALDGKRTLGPVIDVERIPVTDADVVTAGRAGGGTTVAGGGGARGDATGGAPAARGGRDDWPATKAPFPHRGAFIDARGSVWVRRATRAGETRARYDVFDAAGELVARYALPERTRIVGVGATMVFGARATDDGERLDLFRIP